MAEMESAVEGRTASVLFAGFRALGLFSNEVPHVVRYSALKRRFYVTTCVGKSFHTYDVQKLSLVAVSNSVPQDICCMAADGRLVFAAYGNVFSAFARNKEIVHTFKGHKAEIHLLQPFGDHVISVDTDSVLIIWHIYSEEEYLQLTFDKSVFKISTILHPSTYLNKVLLGSEQGSLQLWNIKSNKLLYTFPGWKVGVTALQQAPAVDVVAIGLVSGQVVIHNIKYDETLMKFHQDWGPITSISFRTDGHPIMAAGSERLLKFWNFKRSTIGAYFLKPRGVKTNSNLTATAVDITSCGNFAIIGLSSGAVDVYNMQSGIHRGNFGDDKAHTGSVRGVAVDGLNQLVVTAGSERLLKQLFRSAHSSPV